ncbi:hypothetical protein CJD38_15330 [Stenotrophobium rhamnosiphilum]|uniref:TonB-dependent receptor n=1 Tax=Stenotrophobium rhamnosiphilum TaxID=2029166 RepID=A0A2T5MCL3_9GAMM|nr:hypothetical protein CJD38_15330 [Stenotrophobium rhamnosiphilum]
MSQADTSAATTEASPPSNTLADADFESLLGSSTDAAGASTEPSPGTAAVDLPQASETAADQTAFNPEMESGLTPSADKGTDANATYSPDPVAVEKVESNIALPDAKRSAQLEEIVVTATKREQSVRAIPVSISALDGKALETLNARQLDDIITMVPGVNLQSTVADKAQQISIRGVGPSDGANQTTGVLLDDVPLTDPYGTFAVADPDPYDMKNVSVLKGPQGTLFGASALNGAIRYEQNKPELETWTGRTFANWQSLKDGSSSPTFGLVLNAPIGDSAAFRVSGVYQKVPGFIDFDTPGRPYVKDGDAAKKWTGRALALWQPTEELSVNLSYMQQKRTTQELSFITNQNAEFVRKDAPTASPKAVEFKVATLDVRYAFDWATLVSQTSRQGKTSVQDINASYTLSEPLAAQGVDLDHAYQNVNAVGYMQELRLVSNDSEPWAWLGGVFYNKYRASIDSDIYFANTNVPALIPGLSGLLGNVTQAAFSARGLSLAEQKFDPLIATERALFGEVTRTLFDDWALTFGGRLYQSQVNGTGTTTGLLTTAFNQSVSVNKNLEVKGHGFSPKFSLSWQASDDLYFYTTASRGFQFGGVNLQPVSIPGIDGEPHPIFKSSTLWNYEIGTRTDWLDRTLRFDITAFHVDWADAQTFELTKSGLGGYVDNVGSVSSNGVEATFNYLTPVEGLSFSTSASYIIAKTNSTFNDAGGNSIAPGTDMPNSPRVQTSSVLSYKLPSDLWKASASVMHSYQGKAYNDLGHNHVIGNYHLLNFNLNVGRSDLPLAPSLSFGVTNLTNEKAIVGISAGPNAEGTIFPTSYSRPRMMSLRLDLAF